MFVRISWARIIYISVFDIWALAIVFFAIRHVRRADQRDLIAALVLLIAWPAVMIAAEIATNFMDEGLGRTVEPGTTWATACTTATSCSAGCPGQVRAGGTSAKETSTPLTSSTPRVAPARRQGRFGDGDVVIFSPVALDLTRNLIAKDFVCILHAINYSKVETFVVGRVGVASGTCCGLLPSW